MSFRVRPAVGGDYRAVYQMAKLTGGGFTNLPADRDTLVEKLARSEKSFSRRDDSQTGDLYMFVLEDPKSKKIRGTCQVFGQVGVVQPFYSYHVSTLTQTCPELGKTFRNQRLSLTTDLEGSSEVGGLFLHPEMRAGGWGALLARSRYLFMKQHRGRFGDRTLAELRGVMDEAGQAPFWDALAGKFFGMTFPEADEFNAVHGTQFIADLMPRSPIYVALLTDAAKAVMGQPHPTGKAALRMLEHEGFRFDRYIDIFDGGPTVTAPTDQIRTIREARSETVREIADGGSARMLVSAGRLKRFRACYACVKTLPKKGIMIDREAAELLEVGAGDEIEMAAR
jgi:arginine N-succinyltransferase